MSATDVRVTVDPEQDIARHEPCSVYTRFVSGDIPCSRPGRVRIFVRCPVHAGSEAVRWLCFQHAAGVDERLVKCSKCNAPVAIIAVDA